MTVYFYMNINKLVSIVYMFGCLRVSDSDLIFDLQRQFFSLWEGKNRISKFRCTLTKYIWKVG